MSFGDVSLGERISYARSLGVTVPLICLYTAVMGSLSILSSLFDSTGKLQHGCARTWARMILWTSRVHVAVSGAEHLKPGAAYVLCVNHQSHMDIPILLAALPMQFRFAAKKSLFRIPFLGWHLTRSGHIPIDRENPRAAVKSMREAALRIREGAPLLIFPEGATSLDGQIHPFKGGGFVLASRSMVPTVPIAVRGSRRILVPKTRHLRGGRVEVLIGEPIPSEGFDASDLAERVRAEIVSRFEGIPA